MNDINDPTRGNKVRDKKEKPSPPTLLKDPTVTIYFDGLIYSAFDEKQRLYQTAVLTQAEEHHLKIEVRFRREKELLFPTDQQPWNPAHKVIKELAPFWVYVDSGNGVNPKEFSSSLHLPDRHDEQSFAHIFNFDKAHGRPLVPKPETYAEFNFPQGTCYSAENVKADLKFLPPHTPIEGAEPKGKVKVSTQTGLDIDAVSDAKSKKFIVLATQAGREFFRFELEPGKHYEIKLLNQPIPKENGAGTHGHPHPEPREGHGEHGGNGGSGHIDHAKHFLQFYDLFGMSEKDPRFIVHLKSLPTELPDSPPCVGTGGDTKGGLGGGS